jgi:hypothetical protein
MQKFDFHVLRVGPPPVFESSPLRISTQTLELNSSACYRAVYCRPTLLSGPHLVLGLLYGVQLVLAYFLMLIVMTYNSYLTVATVLGAVFGHWLFTSFRGNSASMDSFTSDACH